MQRTEVEVTLDVRSEPTTNNNVKNILSTNLHVPFVRYSQVALLGLCADHNVTCRRRGRENSQEHHFGIS